MANKFFSVVGALLFALSFASAAQAQYTAQAPMPLSQVKVGVLYENVTDGQNLGRSVSDTNAILKDARADFIFRGFWKWEPIVESPDLIPLELQNMARELGKGSLRQSIEKSGKNYSALKRWIEGIKFENPSLIFCGAVPAQHMARVEIDALTGRVYTSNETWAMALDPQKWRATFKGKAVTKEQIQAKFFGGKGESYNRHKANAYFPDITNPDFQSLFESWAKRQIDIGADAIWIDMLLAQTRLFYMSAKDINHPAVRDSYMAAVKIVDDLHRYGAAKGKNVLVGSWGLGEKELASFSPPLALDFVTVTPSKEEIESRQLDDAKWTEKLAVIRQVYGNTIPVFAFIDWSLEVSPLVSFSQKLSVGDQKNMLQVFDAYFTQRGVNFIYPVHGGYMGKDPGKRSFGKSSIYDSLAPEFDTIGTIKALAAAKKALKIAD